MTFAMKRLSVVPGLLPKEEEYLEVDKVINRLSGILGYV